MKQVPPEVLVQILNFLDIRELCRSAQVCTQWRDLVSYQHGVLWKNLFDKRWGSTRVNQELVEDDRELDEIRSKKRKIETDWKKWCSTHYQVYKNWRNIKSKKKEKKGHRLRYNILQFKRIFDSPISALQFDDSKVISGDFSGNITLFQLSTGLPFQWIRQHHNGFIKCLEFTKDILATGGTDKVVKIMDLATGSSLCSLQDSDSVSSLALSKTDSLIATGNDTGVVKLWDIRSGQKVKAIKTSDLCNIICVKFEGPQVTCVSVDSTMHSWNIGTSEEMQKVKFYKGWIECAYFDEDTLIAGSFDRLIKVFSRKQEKIIKIMEGHSGTVFSLAFDKSKGKGTNLLVTGGSDNKIKVWDLDTYKCMNTLDGFKNSVQCLQFTESKLVAGSLDKNIILYDFDPYNTLNSL